MKNVVECQKEFLAYFNALETRSVTLPLGLGISCDNQIRDKFDLREFLCMHYNF